MRKHRNTQFELIDFKNICNIVATKEICKYAKFWLFYAYIIVRTNL
jgi:hypothetical protein